MATLYDFGQAITQIRDASDAVEVKGARNAGLISFIYDKCNEIIAVINEVARQATEEVENQDEVGDDNGENDS